MPEPENAVVGIPEAVIAKDGDSASFVIEDEAGKRSEFKTSFEMLSQMIVRLLAIQRVAGERRHLAGSETAHSAFDGVLLPFSAEQCSVGLTSSERRLLMRITSDNDLIWDFLFPSGAIPDLIAKLNKIEALREAGASQSAADIE